MKKSWMNQLAQIILANYTRNRKIYWDRAKKKMKKKGINPVQIIKKMADGKITSKILLSKLKILNTKLMTWKITICELFKVEVPMKNNIDE